LVDIAAVLLKLLTSLNRLRVKFQW